MKLNQPVAGEMEVDFQNTSSVEEENRKNLVVILVGAPGSGKSTFCEDVMRSARRPWVRICQDTIANGKSGTKPQCLKSAAEALKNGKSVFIDRCNLDQEQRLDFMKLLGPEVGLHAVVLDLPAQVCISRSVKRSGHEGNLQGGKAAAVVNKMLKKKELPNLSEGFSRITFCQKESDVQDAVNTYSALGSSDTLPSGCFGQKNPDAKVQLGIMRFLKKVEVPENSVSNMNDLQRNVSEKEATQTDSCENKPKNISFSEGNTKAEVKEGGDKVNDALTLAFPSISTADFQFNHEKASDIIVEKVQEFLNKIGNARLVLVDLTNGSKILPLVKAKAAQKNIDANKFFTFVGDITRLHTIGGLRCSVIANAANWRLKPGGGGVNAAIFSAAGPGLVAATKERADSLTPGSAIVVPLPATSSLYEREGVTHVIHVLGPNMNPQRPNCLSNDYTKGCKILRDAYSSLFEGFASIVRDQATEQKRSGQNELSNSSQLLQKSVERSPTGSPNNDLKIKRKDSFESERSKKCKGESHLENDKKIDVGETRSWGSWAQSLYYIAMNPEKRKNDVIEIEDDVVVLNDLYPKAQRHILVLARKDGLNSLADIRKEHLQLLRTMHSVGLKWAKQFQSEDASLIFRIGYHSVPSMRQLHLHVISQDFDSKHLKNKKHWNSFNTAFFRDSVDIIEEIDKYGKTTLNNAESLMSMELRCHRCRSVHPNIPRLKSHISNCRAPFPDKLLQNGYLILAPSGTGNET